MAITGRALPLLLHERQGSQSKGLGEGDTAGQECRASKAVAHTYTLTLAHLHPHTSTYMGAVSPAPSCSSCNHALHAARRTTQLRLFCPFPPTPSFPPERDTEREHSLLACRPVVYIRLMYTLLTGPMI